jgi:hypothetical protein
MSSRIGKALLAASLAACSSPHHVDPASTALVVGVQGDQVVGFVGTVHVTTSVDGVGTSDDTVDLSQNPKALPKEVKLSPTRGNAASVIEVKIDGFASPGLRGGDAAQVLSRTARTSFAFGETKLLRIALENRCIFAQPGVNPCSGTQTCIAGRCQDNDVPADQLEDYSPGWASDAPDQCKPIGHGDPTVIVGTGQTDFLPITDGQTLQAERGPQGGHHIWIATRVRNLKQSGSTTSIAGTQPSTGVQIPPTVFVFTFDPDDGGYCKLYGLRYQLDNGGIDYKQFLGKPLDVSVTVQDASGAQATGIAHINVAPTVLGE